MTKKLIPIEVNNFVGGLITDANPLSFPDKATIDEQNMIMNPDGTRERRLGIDAEEGFTVRTTGSIINVGGNLPYTTYNWENVAGIPDLTFAVLQLGNYIAIYNTSYDNLSTDGLVYEETLTNEVGKIGFVAIDGMLVAATGEKEVYYYEYDEPTNTITKGSYRLLIRDLFGVEDIIDGINYREGTNIAKRPEKKSGNHFYNLRNQTFGNPRLGGGWFGAYTEIMVDPIAYFRQWTNINNANGGRYPSNADSVLDCLYPNTESHVDPITERFHPKELTSNAMGNLSAPKGFFIIDALDRGQSRMEEITKLLAEKSILEDTLNPTSLSFDSSPGGAKVLAEYAGRVFYAGFTSEVVDGDEYSPRMSSYVLFSKLIESPADLKVCYQAGDPTSKDYSEVLDTDGGFVRLEGAHGILAMMATAQGLCVIARNGVWLISGEDRGQFKATSYSTSKLSSHGCDCPTTVVNTGDSFWFWSSEGIFSCSPNQYGDLVIENKSSGFVQRYFDQISDIDKAMAVGIVDTYDRCIRWVYGNLISGDTTCYELVYDMDFQCFYPNKFMKPTSATYPIVVAPFIVPPFRSVGDTSFVYVEDDNVIINVDDQVITPGRIVEPNLKEVKYVIITASSDKISYTFAEITDVLHRDWYRLLYDDINDIDNSIDAFAYMVTGWASGGDFQRLKQAPFLTMHFYKTENGFTEDYAGDWEPINQSSCILQTQWNWANHVNSGKWGREFQSYRINRRYYPADINDGFDNGFYTVVTRNKLRGSGKVLSILMKSEPLKHMKIIGWSMMMGLAGGV